MPNAQDSADHIMYCMAVHQAHVWEERGDLDGYVYWWAMRCPDLRTDPVERGDYEAWKTEQLGPNYCEKQRLRRMSKPALVELPRRFPATPGSWEAIRYRKPTECTHKYGLAGGYSECSSCK